MMAVLAALTSTDLWFWDDALPPGQGVGLALPDDRVVLRWDAAKDAYEVAPVVAAERTAVAAVTADGERHRVREVEVALSPGAPLAANVLAGPAERLPAVGDGRPTPKGPVPIDTMAPFPVLVDYATSSVVPAIAKLPPNLWPLVAGSPVTLSGRTWTVLTLEGDDLRLAGVPEALRRVPNPNGRRLPSGYALAAAIAVAALLLWRRR